MTVAARDRSGFGWPAAGQRYRTAAACAMKLQRVRRMGLAELVGRTRQEASKWWERVAANAPRRRSSWSAVQCRQRLEAFREAAPSRFFVGAGDERTPALLADRASGAMGEVIAGAQQTMAGRFDLLGYRGLSFGDPVDWHLDPVSQRRAPLVHWGRLDPLDSAIGDSKVVWELNRHQWLVELGQAYRTTGDERYGQVFATHVGNWLHANPVGQGINWASSLEIALRLMAWCWALVLFRRSPALSPELFARMWASIEEHAGHVERYLSYYFSPNTHLTGEALGLFYAGTMFPDMAPASRWRERGAQILIAESSRHVLPDGVYFEQSTCYQRYTVEIALQFLVLGARNGFPIPPVLGERVQSMLDFLLSVCSPGGQAPPIGDSDGGWLLPLSRRSAGDLRGVFGPAAALFGRPDYAWAAGGVVPELLWLLGPAGLATFESLRPVPPAAPASRVFADGGYAVMRDGWGAEGHHLLFDVGPLGCRLSGGHGHADLLSIQCSCFGVPFLVDPGTGTYADEDWRSFFRSTAAHSTVMVDGAGQAVPAGPFAWRQQPRARLRRWLSTEAFDFADADHDAYARLPDPVRHRRRVLFVKPRYWVIVDDLDGAASHEVELRFQLAPMEAAVGPDLWSRATAAGRALLLRPFAEAPLQVRLSRGCHQPRVGWVSPDYGRRQPAPMIVYSATAPLPLRIVTLLLPIEDPAAPPPAVHPLRHEAQGLVGLVFDDGQETVSVDDRDGLLVHSSSTQRSS